MQRRQNRAPRVVSGPAQAPAAPGASRATSGLPETRRAANQAEQPPALPDLRGLLLVALVAAWLAGLLLENWLALPLWPLLIAGAGCGGLGLLALRFNRRTLPDRWLTLTLLLLGCLALGGWRLALANPAGDPAAVSSFIGRTVVMRGTVSAEPNLRNRSLLLQVDSSSLSLDGGHTWRDVHGTVAVLTLWSNGPYAPDYGDTVELRGALAPVIGGPTAPASAGGQNATSGKTSTKMAQPVAAPAGVFAAMTFPSLLILQRGGGNLALAWLFHLRQQLAQAISQSLPEPEASLLIGILLGLKTPVLRAQYSLFQASGTVHLVVTSGFKVTVLSGMLAAAAQRLPGRRRALGLVLGSILAYTVLSGAGPAALRAGIMGLLLVIAPRAGRSYNLYTALAFAALLMSAWSPYVLWDVGFQLSTLGTLGIALLAPPLVTRLERPLGHLPGGHLIAELLAATIAAQVGTLPIQAITFGQLSLVAPLTNLLAVPMLSVLLGMGVLIGALGLALPLAGGWAGWVCWPLLWLVYQVIARSAALPFASLAVGPLDLRLAWLYYAGLGLAVLWLLNRPRPTTGAEKPRLTKAQRRRAQQVQMRWRLAGALVLIAVACLTTSATLPDHRLHLVWLDVGPRGQAMLLETPGGHTVLIDGGGDPAALETALGQQLPFWQRTIDVALLTNPKAGHLPGLLDALNHYHISQAADAGMLHPSAAYATWRTALDQRQIPYARIRQGANIVLEPGITLQVLSPGPILSQDQANVDTNALILRLVTPGLRVLFLGETDEMALEHLEASGLDLRADLLQIALRPDQSLGTFSALSTLLPIIQPEMVVITPTPAAGRSASAPPLEAPETIRTLSIAETGTLALTADSSRWWFES